MSFQEQLNVVFRLLSIKKLGGYYFCGSANGYANKSLSVGMLARVRGE